mmetsp:Transcript_28355/g.27296  ORF Transcript_28355/g.27296 Transcript_28355/m.27296 type:complete len:132 (-) Transcript_28355:1066-1461(-)
MEKNAKTKSVSNMMGVGQMDKHQKKVVHVTHEKDLVSLTLHRHIHGGTTIPLPNEQIILQSGECNWRFKFKLIGVERLNLVFNEIRKKVATDNLKTQPRNVTLKANKVQTVYKMQETMKQQEKNKKQSKEA